MMNSLASSNCFHVARLHQSIVRLLLGRALLQSSEAPWVFTLSPHQLPWTWDKHSLPSQGNNEILVMQSLLGGPLGASWPHLECSCPQFLLQSSGGQGTSLGSGGQTVMLKGETHGRMCIHPLRKCPGSMLLCVVYRCTFPLSFPAFKARPGWRLFRESHLGLSSRRKILIDFSGMLAELWL